MPNDRTKHHRRSIRLPGHDYTSPGAYFVTICVQRGQCLLGQVVDGEMRLNELGQIAADSWEWLGAQYSYVSLDAWVIMPNHMHGIIVIADGGDTRRGGSRTAPTRTALTRTALTRTALTRTALTRTALTQTALTRTAPTRTALTRTAPTKRKPLGRLVGAFKTVSTKRINQLRDTPGIPFWQRNYWEHIIRNDQSLDRIREYIGDNPVRWPEDQLHPDAPPNQFNQWVPPES